MNNILPYNISVTHLRNKTEITLKINNGCLSTSLLPHTYNILQNELPHIFASQCFNEGDIPFRKEVVNTETGHLFEHILLEYLSNEKLQSGFRIATYSGETCWNWRKEQRGVFHITVSAKSEERGLFYAALENSLQLFEKIMWNKARNFVGYYNDNRSDEVYNRALNLAV